MSVRSSRGFTLIEMVVAMVIMAIISAVALPNLSNFFSPSVDSARETVLAALRQAKSRAYSHRRLVCLTASGTSVNMLQVGTNPATSCAGGSVPGPDGSSNFLSAVPGASVSSSPLSVLYFQPDGRLTSDAAGLTTSNYVLTITVGTQGSTTINVNGASASAQ
jgi:MSHA pilin protein MshC